MNDQERRGGKAIVNQPKGRAVAPELTPMKGGLAALVGLVILTLALAVPSAVSADEWSVIGRVDQRFEADSNPRLMTTGEDTTYGSITTPEIRLRGRSPLLDVSLVGRFDFAWYDDSDLSSNDQLGRLESSYRTQTSIWGLNAEVDRDTTRTSEFTDTGIFDVLARRLRYQISPSYTAIVTPRNRLRVNGSYTDVNYDTSSLSDYTTLGGGLTWFHDYTQKTELTLGAQVYHFETQSGPDSETDLYALLLGATHKYSERLKVSASIGPRYQSSDTATTSANSIGVQLGASVEYLMSEQTTFTGSIDRSVTGSGSGTTPERNTLKFSATHQFLPRWQFLFGATYIKDEKEPTAGTDGREYISLEPAVRWQVARTVDLSTSYRYRRQEYDSGSEADSNAVFLTLTYRPLPWMLSR